MTRPLLRRRGWLLAGALLAAATGHALPPDAAEIPNPFELAAPPAAATTRIDERVFARLHELGLERAPLCSDAVFLRRAFLDVIGTLPTAEEARRFLADANPQKRAALIDALLARDEFADYWAMKWSDLLRVKAEFPINLWPNAAQAYHRWIHAALRDNLPYDQFARELLTSSGSNFRSGPVNFYRALPSHEAPAIARTVALTLMGTRAEKWPAARLDGMAKFFGYIGYKATGEWKEEIVFFDAQKFAQNETTTAAFPDGTPATLSSARDPREQFAEWLITPQNPWFMRAIVNRTWAALLGRGIVHEPDDLRPDNPPANAELLNLLEGELIAARYNVKQLMRLILGSQTYQFSSIVRTDRPEAEASFAAYPLRRLEAEVLIDAINQITGTTEKYTSAIPEPFTFMPDGQRAIALPDGSITSTFLEMFGRPARDTGLAAERNNRITATQRLHLLNSSHVQRKIEQGPRLQAILRTRGGPGEVVDTLYLSILSRFPTDQERIALRSHPAAARDSRVVALDVAWALINSTEFLYRH